MFLSHPTVFATSKIILETERIGPKVRTESILLFSLTAVFVVSNATNSYGSVTASATTNVKGVPVLHFVGATPAEAGRIKEVYAKVGPTMTVKQTRDGFEVTGEASEQLAAVITLMSSTNGDFQSKVLELENQNKSLHENSVLQQSKTTELFRLLKASLIGFGICLVALVGIIRNQVTKMKVKLSDLETSLESRKQ